LRDLIVMQIIGDVKAAENYFCDKNRVPEPISRVRDL